MQGQWDQSDPLAGQEQLADLQELSFEEALQSLEEQVRILESGRASLEASMAAFVRGSQMARQCQAKLDEADERIRQLVRVQDEETGEPDYQEAELPQRD